MLPIQNVTYPPTGGQTFLREGHAPLNQAMGPCPPPSCMLGV